MKKLVFSICLMTSPVIVTACSTLNVDPCSAQGIEMRLDRALKDFGRANRGDINDIRGAAEFLDGETTTGAMKLAFAAQSLRRLLTSFEDDVVPEIQDIALQCDAAQPIMDIFVDFLRDEGVNRRVLQWVENFSTSFDS